MKPLFPIHSSDESSKMGGLSCVDCILDANHVLISQGMSLRWNKEMSTAANLDTSSIFLLSIVDVLDTS